ncbi:S8 family serine peptidase [Marinobacterium mangrovicola]|uniref:Subtilisin family serine protease n=1 Tax=Marinobacterium mangrovicola TaxID=1476959 RepID=A0A4R1GMG9_9GAMM|nr:S8 family serine peptidase [Marinobacterium mangrovicola]TCK08411.1 subtilisin family serine protease [Marinobacterium mangrovicola]
MNVVARLVSVFLLGCSTLAFAAPERAAAENAKAPFIRGQIVVDEDSKRYPRSEVIKYLPLSGLTVLAVEPGEELAALARERRLGRKAMLNTRVQAFAATNDPFASYQWNMERIQAQTAWEVSTGAGIVVAVLDTGLNPGGADGIGCVVNPPDNDIVNQDSDAFDGNGHGTHVSGTIAQKTNNAVGVVGLAYGACILPVKVLSDSGSGGMADIAEGIRYAVDNGAKVINMSLGVSARARITGDPIVDPALEYAFTNNVVVVAAAGNDGFKRNVSYPAINANTIAVGATGYDDAIAPYSNQGAGLNIVAPGGNNNQDLNADGFADGILQEVYSGTEWGYYFYQGTSMASPHVAAAAAILLADEPNLSPSQVLDRLRGSALDLGARGYDSTFGDGLIQVADALGGGSSVSGNSAPQALFEYACVDLRCEFTSTSQDYDGSIVEYAWDFGDGATDNVAAPSHDYSAADSYDVRLTVLDNEGASDSVVQTVLVVNPSAGCIDADGDGYCSVATGGGDCDDTTSDIYPGHPDKGGRWGRDGLDNDCDGEPDNG